MPAPPGLRALLEGARKLDDDGHAEDAFALVQQAVERFPEEPRAHIALAGRLRGRGDGAAALEHVEEALDLAPDDPTTLVWAAGLLLALGEPGEAARLVERAAVDDGGEFEDRDVGLLVDGALAWIDGRDDDAERLMREALAARPDRVMHARMLAWFLVEDDRLHEALEIVRRGLAEHPGDEELRDHLATIARRLAGGDATETPSAGGGGTSSTAGAARTRRWPRRFQLPSGRVLVIHARSPAGAWSVGIEGADFVAWGPGLGELVADALEAWDEPMPESLEELVEELDG